MCLSRRAECMHLGADHGGSGAEFAATATRAPRRLIARVVVHLLRLLMLGRLGALESEDRAACRSCVLISHEPVQVCAVKNKSHALMSLL